MDKEQKIAEIRKSAEEARKTDRSWVDGQDYADDVEFLLDELDRLRAERESHGPEGRNYTNQQVVELRLERERLIEESRKLREELAKEKYANSIIEMDRDNWISDYSELLKELQSAQQEIERLREERDKLIEGLRWYADEDTHMIKRRSDGDYAPIALDHGKRARDILREIGVTVE